MCGIVGWLSCLPAHPVDGTVLARMRDTMVHRGPDGDGLWVAPGRERGVLPDDVIDRPKRKAVVDMLARNREGRADFALYVWTIYNAVARFDYWVDKSREVRVA